MASTSGTYKFQSVAVEPLIREAYEIIGIAPEMIVPQKLDSAKRSINLMLLDWMNKSINLWTLKTDFLGLIKGQGQYVLPDKLNNITQVNLRSSTRVLNGTPASSAGGMAKNAFDGNAETACTQNDPNGHISYVYGVRTSNIINFIGIQSNETQTYTIKIEYSQDNENWKNLQSIAAQEYSKGTLKWFDIVAPVSARAYRIKEGGGAVLDIQELYFNNNVTDQPISNTSRYEYLSLPNKKLEGQPKSYYLDRGMDSILNIWPTPPSQLYCLQYAYEKVMEDVGLYTETIEMPSILYPSLVWGLSFNLALKFNPELAGELRNQYEDSFKVAANSYSENVVFSINQQKQ